MFNHFHRLLTCGSFAMFFLTMGCGATHEAEKGSGEPLGRGGAGGAGAGGTRMGSGGSLTGSGGARPGSGGAGGGAGDAGTATQDSGAVDAAQTTDAALPPGGPNTGTSGTGFYRMERLTRGVVAVPVTGGIYVGWRMFGYEYDATAPTATSYNLYRNGMRIASVTDSTNYLDAMGTATSTYAVRPAINGTEQGASETARVWAQNYLRIPLQVPPGGTNPGVTQCGPADNGGNANEAYTYSANDASVGDLDGDGQYEIILKWDPSNSQDNSFAGCTGNVFLDAYKFDVSTGASMRLWRIDLGINIRAGAHYTQFMVQDFDGDGKAEIAVKTAPGTRDATGSFLHLGPAATDDDMADYRGVANDPPPHQGGYVLTGPEYLTVFNGETGAEMATVPFGILRGTVGSWGDTYGNRVDRFLASTAYLDDTGLPSFIMARGYYTRTTLTAWNWRNQQLTKLWQFDSATTPRDAAGHAFSGQGSHSMMVANIDDDPQQEILYGAMTIDNDGKGLCSTGFNHGDAEHVGDLVPSRPGLEMFMCNEDGAHPAYHIRDARTCEIIQSGPINGADTGRCVAGDVWAGNPGAEMWASSVDGVFSATSGRNVGVKPGSQNFLIWWDADETRELLDSNHIDKYTGVAALTRLLTANGVSSNNGTKSTPALTADLLGDWREEVLWRETNSSALRLYTTTDVTRRRIYTLMHDAQYRSAVSWQNGAYNQPPHTGFAIGADMAAPPVPNITVR